MHSMLLGQAASHLKHSPERYLCLNWWHNFMLSSQIGHSEAQYLFRYNHVVRFCKSTIQATQHCMHAYQDKAVETGRCTKQRPQMSTNMA